MKTLKLSKTNSKVGRELISKMGEAIYHSDGIKSVKIIVSFKDGSQIGFHRSEEKDDIDRIMEDDEDE